ncbi:DDE-type integrase/transposase/recombinase [Yoonia sp. R2-816]|uniref:DDE-type integrase/transposase/recombinase n=1 Tax=Yoonia sp. R2-816 TaxID=3342638 RepID=UPI00372723AD
MARSTLQYKAAPKDDEALRLAMIRLAKQYGRDGYRKVAELLGVEGWSVNHKKTERRDLVRHWSEDNGRAARRRPATSKAIQEAEAAVHKDSSIIRLRPQHPNHIWSVDFVHDKLSNGRPYKMLTVLDEYTQEALCVAVKPKMNSADVLDALYPLLLRRGKPEYIRSDNGSEFIATALQDWLRKVGIKPI